jgi:hypothetical protein
MAQDLEFLALELMHRHLQATSDVHHAALSFSANSSGRGLQARVPRFPEATGVASV